MEKFKMNIKLENTVENYKERVMRLGLFDCLYKLEQKKKKNSKGKVIDYWGLGLLTLLFFFENMLIRNKRTGVKELAKYFNELNTDEIEDIEFEEIARSIIDVFRPSGGKRNRKEFYNWETRKFEFVEYSYLKASKSDIESNTQYYTLDEHGLELIFATKEYYSEFQLSINQLLLRKQLEKGEFLGAIRQIDEMRVDVEILEERISKIKYEIQSNILSEKTYKRYQDLIEDISKRLKRENEEFDELIAFVNQTRQTLSYEIQNEKEVQAYRYIIRIQKELIEVHRKHRKLLEKSIELKISTLQVAQEALYYIGIENFNFKKELTARVFASPLPINSIQMLIKPFLYLEKNESWSPITVFAPQRLLIKEKKIKSNNFIKKKTQEELEKETLILQNKFGQIMTMILNAIGNERKIRLEEFIDWIRKNKKDEWLEEQIFYYFFIILHQKSPLKPGLNKKNAEGLLKVVTNQLVGKYISFSVKELKTQLKINERYSISDLEIELESVIYDI